MFNSILNTPYSLKKQLKSKNSFLLTSTTILVSVALAVALTQPQSANANLQDTKIGFVNTERILRESAPARAAQIKIEGEFKKREEELQRIATLLRAKAEEFDKEASILSEADRVKYQRDLANLDADLQRKRREFQEDINRRRNDEFSNIVGKANETIKLLAEQEKYDLIIQDAVTVNPRVDITDSVIQKLSK